MVKLIKFNGKEYPLRISYYALKKLGEEKGIKITNMDTDAFDPSMMESLLFYGLESGARFEGKTLDLTRADMENVLDDCFFEFLQMIPEFFPKVEGSGKTKNQEGQ